MPEIVLDSVTVRRSGQTLLEGVSATIPNRSATAVIGPNGAGKTTLLRCLLGLTRYEGRIAIGRAGRSARIGYVPQRLEFDRELPVTVLDLLAIAEQRRPIWLRIGRSLRQPAMRLLERVHAAPLARRPLGRLSGGELQRVQLALALQRDPELLILDEPASGVDVVGEQLFCDLLEQTQDALGATLVMVSHDLSVVSKHATHVLCLNRELVAFGPTDETLTRKTLNGAFGPHAVFGDRAGLAAHGHDRSPSLGDAGG